MFVCTQHIYGCDCSLYFSGSIANFDTGLIRLPRTVLKITDREIPFEPLGESALFFNKPL